jgi:hypothetical protein
MDLINLTATALRRAADVQERLQSLEKELAQILGVVVSTATNNHKPRGKTRMSAAVRARIAAAARARWAKIKAARPARVSTQQPRRKMSAAGRARLSAMAKARWKKAKAAGKKAL